ncbi:MAG: ABC transporter ATP-binding protein, partial [Clostridia bacterium]|nr:ABC transporter ATP-binding protein [Clostridia bacterium]
MKRNVKKTITSKSVLRRVLGFLKPYAFLTILSIILSGASVFLTLYLPILIGQAIDLIIEAGNVDFEALVPLLFRGGVAVVVTAVLTWIISTINNKITFEVIRDVRREAFKKLQMLPVSYIDSHPFGDIVSRIVSDVDTFADGLLLGFTQLFTGVLTILGTLIFMFYLSPIIALIVVVLTPLSLFVARYVSKHTYDMFKLQSETRGEQTSLIDEAIGQQKVVKAFGREDEIMEKYCEIDERLVKCSLKATFFSSLVNPSTRFVNSVVYAAVGCFGALSVIGRIGILGSMSVGTLSVFLSYANQYTKPFNEISGVITELQNSLACAGRIFDFIAEKPQTPDKEDAVALNDVKGAVRLENVS